MHVLEELAVDFDDGVLTAGTCGLGLEGRGIFSAFRAR